MTVCRICLSDECDDQTGSLISPCPCRGTAAYVHEECVVRSYIARAKWAEMTCPTCQHYYTGGMSVKLGRIGLETVEAGTNDEDSIHVAVVLGNLAHCLVNFEGRVSEAVELLERALTIKENVMDGSDASIGVTLSNLGAAYSTMGDGRRAISMLERAVAVAEKSGGKRTRGYAISLCNLACALMSMGTYEEAKLHLEEAVGICEREVGRGSCEVCKINAKLGIALNELGHSAQAHALLEKVVEDMMRIYGAEHINTATVTVDLARAENDLGYHQRAKEHLMQSMAIFSRDLSSDDVKIAGALHELGAVHGDLAEFREKEEVLQAALAIKEKAYGASHRSFASTLSLLGSALRENGCLHEALKSLLRALHIQEALGFDHIDRAFTLWRVAEVWFDTGDFAEAYYVLILALQIFQVRFPTDHVHVVNIQAKLEAINASSLSDREHHKEQLSF